MTDIIEMAKKCGAEKVDTIVMANSDDFLISPAQLEAFRAECVNEAMHDTQELIRKAVEEERENFNDLTNKINEWRNAYPVSVFPEPDTQKANAILQQHGMTIDAISAHCMRHVLKGVGEIVDDAIRSRSTKENSK